MNKMEGEKINVILDGNTIEAQGLVSFKYIPNNKDYLVYTLGETINQNGTTLDKLYVSEINSENLQPIDNETWEKLKLVISSLGGDLSNNNDIQYMLIEDNKKVGTPKKLGTPSHIKGALIKRNNDYKQTVIPAPAQEASAQPKFVSPDLVGDPSTTEQVAAESPAQEATTQPVMNAFNATPPAPEQTTVNTGTEAPAQEVVQPAPVAAQPVAQEVVQTQPVEPVAVQPVAPAVPETPQVTTAPIEATPSVVQPVEPVAVQPTFIEQQVVPSAPVEPIQSVPTTPVVESAPVQEVAQPVQMVTPTPVVEPAPVSMAPVTPVQEVAQPVATPIVEPTTQVPVQPETQVVAPVQPEVVNTENDLKSDIQNLINKYGIDAVRNEINNSLSATAPVNTVAEVNVPQTEIPVVAQPEVPNNVLGEEQLLNTGKIAVVDPNMNLQQTEPVVTPEVNAQQVQPTVSPELNVAQETYVAQPSTEPINPVPVVEAEQQGYVAATTPVAPEESNVEQQGYVAQPTTEIPEQPAPTILPVDDSSAPKIESLPGEQINPIGDVSAEPINFDLSTVNPESLPTDNSVVEAKPYIQGEVVVPTDQTNIQNNGLPGGYTMTT